MATSDQFPVGTLPAQMVGTLSAQSVIPSTPRLDKSKFIDSSVNSTAEIQLIAGEDGVSRALNRAAYARTSFHNASTTFVVQVSNYPNPGDTDWEDIDTASFAHIDYPVKWVRVKAAAGTVVYVQSAHYLYA